MVILIGYIYVGILFERKKPIDNRKNTIQKDWLFFILTMTIIRCLISNFILSSSPSVESKRRKIL